MTGATLAEPILESVETRLRDALAQGDAMLSAAAPILRHLLIGEDQNLFSDEIVARVRGMLAHVARQLLHAQAEAAGIADPRPFAAEREDDLAQRLADETAFLAHVHALAIEGRVALQLQGRDNVDPVLCPLVQELVASRDDSVAGTAMAVVAAQARFIQHHRRMLLPLGELPGDSLHFALLALREVAGEREVAAVAAERAVRDAFDEGRGRLGLISRLVAKSGKAVSGALDIGQAGLAIFATALAAASGQERDATVLSLSGGQAARLTLAMRAAGLEPSAVAKQARYFHFDLALPEGFDKLSADRAAMLLATGPHGA
jgi:hypothetical protein